jgi:hypothetical protein
MAEGPWRRRTERWTPERIAETLVPARDLLVNRLPGELAAARGLSRDQCELIVDEAIDYMVTEYDKPIADRLALDRAFWATASFRVRRVHEGRGATVRAGWQRVDVADLQLPAGDADPERTAVDRIERATLLEFAATLSDVERAVLACKYRGPSDVGRVVLSQRLRMPTSEVRRAERSILRKLERFAAILAAGSLCSHRESAILSLAEGAPAGAQEAAARIHLRHCGACRLTYSTHLRAIRTGALQRRIGQLLPVPASTELTERRRGAPWEALWDWITKPLTHEATLSWSQVAAAGRGAGGVIAAKVAALCLAGGTIVGGGLYCVAQLHDQPPKTAIRAAPPVTHDRTPREPPLPSAGRTASTQHSKIVTVKPRRTTRRRVSGTAFGRGPAATRHEREVPISPAATTPSGAPLPEFEPGPAATAPPQPAAAPATGAPEFP